MVPLPTSPGGLEAKANTDENEFHDLHLLPSPITTQKGKGMDLSEFEQALKRQGGNRLLYLNC